MIILLPFLMILTIFLSALGFLHIDAGKVKGLSGPKYILLPPFLKIL